jgi:CO/xanthine dehydrogenase FAD-binding subunit
LKICNRAGQKTFDISKANDIICTQTKIDDIERHCVTRYAKPKTVDEAVRRLAEDKWQILAGGTDFYPSLGSRPLRENVLDINGLTELRGIAEARDHWRIGARTTWTDLASYPMPPAFNALKQAAAEVGSQQIQNTGTIAGNLCNASPAADGVPPLLVLDAQVEIASDAGLRRLAIQQFIEGNRKTAMQRNELVTAIIVPKSSCAGLSHFLKLGARRYLVISIAMVAARVTVEAGRIGSISLAVGSCSAVAQRLYALETALTECSLLELRNRVEAMPIREISPIDDVRGSAAYRLKVVRELVVRASIAAVARQRETLA